MENHGVNIVNRFFDAYTKRDFEAIKQVLDENSKWIFPGQNPLSGVKKGIDEIVEFFDKMGEIMKQSNVKAEVLIMGSNDNYLLECQHIWTNREEQNLDHIFNPFFTTKKAGKGTGLGLYIVYNELQKINGEISVNCKVKEGSIFKLKFNVKEEENG